MMIAFAITFVFGIYSFSSSVDFQDRTHFNCSDIVQGREDLYSYDQDRIAKMLEFCAYNEDGNNRRYARRNKRLS